MKTRLYLILASFFLMLMMGSANAGFHDPENNGLWVKDSTGELILGCALIGSECYWSRPKL